MKIMNQFTVRNLKKNKVRTFVTILGIILATALFTAVTEGMISVRQYLIDFTEETTGKWEELLMYVPGDKVEEIRKIDGIKEMMGMQEIGYHKLENGKNPNKPYLTIMEIGKNYKNFLPKITIKEGRMARAEDELVVPQHAIDGGGFEVKVGDTVTIETGNRYTENGIAQDALVADDDGNLIETLKDIKTRSYKVVGICDRTEMESMLPEPGYYAFTMGTEPGKFSNIYLHAKDVGKLQNIMEKACKICKPEEIATRENNRLLLYRGQAQSEEGIRMKAVMYSLCAILILIIMVASVSMIYNAFAISISERTKSYGLLKSIGATKKQIRSSVLFEALILCAVGIPLGLFLGLLGTGVVLRYMGILFGKMLTVSLDTGIHLVFSLSAVLIAGGIGILTVIISAFMPALRAIRMPAIDALRQSRDIKMSRIWKRSQKKSMFSSKIFYRLLGFEGILAGKNLKRNRKRQRTIVLSLAISVVLFITSGAFCSYLSTAVKSEEVKGTYDVFASVISDTDRPLQGENTEMLKKRLEGLSGVEMCSYSTHMNAALLVPDEELSKDFKKELSPACIGKKYSLLEASVIFVEDEGYRKFLKENHLDVEKYMDTKNPCPLFDDNYSYMKDNKIYIGNVFTGDSFSGELQLVPDEDKKGRQLKECILDKKDTAKAQYIVEKDDGRDEELSYDLADVCVSLKMKDNGKLEGNYPIGAVNEGNIPALFLPYSVLSNVPKDFKYWEEVFFGMKAKNHVKAADEIAGATDDILEELKNVTKKKNFTFKSGDYADNVESMRALVALVKLLSYSFIGVISIIILANVFNTISTGIGLRRQEFAMLKSVGMSAGGLKKLMNLECLFYGLKGFLYGFPAALVLSYLMYHVLESRVSFGFYIPLYGVAASVLLVFVIVFASMLYAMRKIKDENPMEALRSEMI